MSGRATFDEGAHQARGIAAVLVLLLHLQLLAASRGDWNHWALQFGYFGVDVFFVLSAYLLTVSLRRSAKNYLRRRFLRIGIPYYAVLAGCIALVRWTDYPVRMDASTDGWSHVLFIHHFFPGSFESINQVFWSIGLEMEIYLVLPLLVWLARSNLRRFSLGLIVFGIVSRILAGIDAIGDWNWHVTGFLAHVGIGMWIASKPAFDARLAWVATLLLVGLILVLNAPWIWNAEQYELVASSFTSGPLRILAAGFAGAFLLAMMATGTGPMTAWWTWVADRSYSLYLTHLPALWLASLVAPGNGIWLVGFAMSLVLATLGYHLLERPSLRAMTWFSTPADGRPSAAIRWIQSGFQRGRVVDESLKHESRRLR